MMHDLDLIHERSPEDLKALSQRLAARSRQAKHESDSLIAESRELRVLAASLFITARDTDR